MDFTKSLPSATAISRIVARMGGHGSYHSAEFIFPDFTKQSESSSLTDLFMRNANVGFQLLAITVEMRWNKFESGGMNNLRAKQTGKILNCSMQSAYNSLQFFGHFC